MAGPEKLLCFPKFCQSNLFHGQKTVNNLSDPQLALKFPMCQGYSAFLAKN